MREPYDVVEWRLFRKRYPAALLRRRGALTRAFGRKLRDTLGHKRIRGLALHPRHNQTTLWWYEQGLLALLGAAGWDVAWITDAAYRFDDERIAATVRIHREPVEVDTSDVDAVISLFPSDRAVREAQQLNVPLVHFAIKNLPAEQPHLVETPPANAWLWTGFAGSVNFHSALRVATKGKPWPARGAPFPVNRYYLPVRDVGTPRFDALLMGSNARDYDLAIEVFARSSGRRFAALCNPADLAAVTASGERNGISLDCFTGLGHVRLVELLEHTRVVVNPIVPPAESHYTNSVPLALGRPVLMSRIRSTEPYDGPGVLRAPLRDQQAWVAGLDRLLSETTTLPHEGALTQARTAHDLDRFFTSALVATLSTGD